MLRKTFKHKNTNKQFVLRKRFSHVPPLRNLQNDDYTIKSYPATQEPILIYPQRAENLSINDDILMQIHDEDMNEKLLEEDDETNTEDDGYPDDNMHPEYLDDEYAPDLESQDESSEERPNIIDDALDPSKLPNNSGNFSPYFDNVTTALLFCWVQKHNISTNAYDDLVSIINHPQFNCNDVITNIRRFRQWRQRLPLLPIASASVTISPKKTPSTSVGSKMAYYLSIGDIIWHVLNNPAIMKHMYFGPGVEANVKSEFWHGTLWAESPLFGQEKIVISQVTYYCGEFIYYLSDGNYKLGFLRSIQVNESSQIILKIQKLLYYKDLPGIFKGVNRERRSKSGEVWMLDNEFAFIYPSQVYNKAIVKLPHLHQALFRGDLCLLEIIYKQKNHWRVRDIQLSYQHPAHSIKVNEPPVDSMPVYKLFLDLYYDDFGTFRNVFHSLGGVYVQFGNMPAHMRKQLKNHFVIGFVPFGGNFNEFIMPFVNELKEFEKGKIMNIQGQDVWVIAGLGVVTADLPQGNDLAGVLRHGVTKGCRTCNIEKNSYTDIYTNVAELSRYKQHTNLNFSLISIENSMTRKKQLSSEFGLKINRSILDELQREMHLQTPQDIYHATAGKVRRLLKLTRELLLQEGENAFIRTWKALEKPKQWARLPNPISHHESFMMSDYLRLAMIMPFILYRFLKVSHIKNNNLALIQQRINVQRSDLVSKAIVKCWVQVAKTMKIAFDNNFTNEKYIELQRCLEAEMIILTKVFEEFVNLPNLHLNLHFHLHAHTYATLCNTQVGIKEMVHRIFKSMVPKTNRKIVELDLIKRYNTIFAIRHLVDGGIDRRLSQPSIGFTSLRKSDKHLFTNWYVTEDNTFFQDDYEDETREQLSMGHFYDIKLKQKISLKDMKSFLTFSLKDVNFKAELFESYNDLNLNSALIHSSLTWYQCISYITEDHYGNIEKVCLRLGDIVTIQEEEYDESYAMIQSIFQHKGNDDKFYVFVVITWFEYINQEHMVLECPIYRLNDKKWRRVFPITVIDKAHKAHFIRRTVDDNHTNRDDYWFKNPFYFTAI